MSNSLTRKKIAIVGSGISGLTCAYLLSRQHDVTLFESNDYLGGHTATKDVNIDGKDLAIDTGFIVFNDRTYPHFIELMQYANIEMQATEMSFSVHNEASGLEYNGHNLNTLFAQRRNLLNWSFYQFIGEILRFNRLAKDSLLTDADSSITTLGEFLAKHQFTEHFADHYILPMVAAIWSSSMDGSREFPLQFFLRFFNNHGLLDVSNRPQWYVIRGGSKSYIPALTATLNDIRLSTPVSSIRRENYKVHIVSTPENQPQSCEVFDDVILACHSDQALKLLADPSESERNILGKIAYRENDVVLHTDRDLLPIANNAIASWNYWLDSDTSAPPIVTYCMNILQGIKTESKICVTLNPKTLNEEKVLRRFRYAHPVFTADTIEAQAQRENICGQNNTHYCGAYWHNGFHEDGVKSALMVCERFGESITPRRHSDAMGKAV